MSSQQQTDITGIILAGGKSTRMGEDKSNKLYKGIPFLQHIIEAMKKVTNKIIIITNNACHTKFGYPCFSDIVPDQGPIGGIYTALYHASTEKNMILSCDVPFITYDILNNLIKQYDPTYDIIAYQNTPLVALYHRSTLNTFLKSIETKHLRLRDVLTTLRVKNIYIKKNMAPYIVNINTPQQYKEAMQWN